MLLLPSGVPQGSCLCAFQVCSLKSPDFLCSSGPEAFRLRSALNPKMLKLQEVATFAPMVNVVVGDLLRRVEFLRRGSQDGVTVSDIASELYKFGFEGSSCFSVSSKFFFFLIRNSLETVNFCRNLSNPV